MTSDIELEVIDNQTCQLKINSLQEEKLNSQIIAFTDDEQVSLSIEIEIQNKIIFNDISSLDNLSEYNLNDLLLNTNTNPSISANVSETFLLTAISDTFNISCEITQLGYTYSIDKDFDIVSSTGPSSLLESLENSFVIQEINTIINNPNSRTSQRMVEMFGDEDLNISFSINSNDNIEIRIPNVNFDEHESNLLRLGNILKNELSKSYGVSTEVFTIVFREGSIIIEITINVGAVCFLRDTPVLTDQGEIPIQEITRENTINGVYVEAISRVINIDNFMILIKKDALAEGVPSTDTCISKNHHIFINGHAIKAKHLVNKKDILKVITGHQIIYNVLLEDNIKGKMIVNNMLVETLNKKYLSKMISNNSNRK
jgi:hypothetical protein